MKITKINYQKAFTTGPFLQEKIGFEAEIDEHIQSVHDALMQLKSMAEDFHKEANPHLYQESKTPVSEWMAPTPPPENWQIQIDSPADVLTAIKDSQSLEELKSYKLLASADKKLYEAYCTRIKELAQ